MTNPALEAVFSHLTGGFVDTREIIAKNNPDPSDVHAPGTGSAPRSISLRPISRKGVKAKNPIVKSGVAISDPSSLTPKQARRQKQVNTVGLAGNAVATAGGAHALYLSLKNPNMPGHKTAAKLAAKIPTDKIPKLPANKATGAAKMVFKDPKKALAASALGWAGLHGVELAADGIAYRALRRERSQLNRKIQKSEVADVTWTAEISKVDDDKRQVFGWCSLSKVNGEPVVDRQNDFVPLDEIEKSAYKYVLESRKGGDMHKRQMKKGFGDPQDEPVHTADLIESFVVTPEKLKQMGLDEDALPHGWWVGFKVNDEDQWQMVKDGKRTGFSIHGSGKRSPGVI